MKRITVALSGGVDSSVAASLLQQQGYEVDGIFMKNWSPESSQALSDCPWEQDQADAEAVCAHLGIPFRSINFETEYYERVVQYFLGEYDRGRTPNPDVMCNKEIKFAAFLQAVSELGADAMATGHYARVEHIGGIYRLLRGVDPGKDQSYFLYTLGQERLAKVLFPLGGYTKPQIRQMAADFRLPTATKKDSQGICFIGHLDLKQFLREHLHEEHGEVKLLPAYISGMTLEVRMSGAVHVGEHRGSMYYTIGERAGELVDNGLYKIARNGDVPALYVVAKVESTIYLTDDPQDKDFDVYDLELEEVTWVSGTPEGNNMVAQVRYQQKRMATVNELKLTDTGATLVFDEPLRAVAAGQSVVLYRGDQVLGGGVVRAINHTF